MERGLTEKGELVDGKLREKEVKNNAEKGGGDGGGGGGGDGSEDEDDCDSSFEAIPLTGSLPRRKTFDIPRSRPPPPPTASISTTPPATSSTLLYLSLIHISEPTRPY
eukprot:TRINITY_DN984_c2_g1_i1.p1 TRINITY_DN984_c2_g1~~TRINITY_DN984_c2_g1_i1.p1  ORF type:complete len:108 (+),score=38.68 TRINITY_DN984_c2_g1_i1:78-401(+)